MFLNVQCFSFFEFSCNVFEYNTVSEYLFHGELCPSFPDFNKGYCDDQLIKKVVTVLMRDVP